MFHMILVHQANIAIKILDGLIPNLKFVMVLVCVQKNNLVLGLKDNGLAKLLAQLIKSIKLKISILKIMDYS